MIRSINVQTGIETISYHTPAELAAMQPTLPELAASKIAAIKAAEAAARQLPVTHRDAVFQATDASWQAITQAVAPDPLPEGYKWIMGIR